MVIVLTKEEKRTFYSFLGLYLGSSLLLVSIISWLFYTSNAKQLEELTISKMQVYASNMSHKIIQAHMKGLNLNLKDMQINTNFKYALYNDKKNSIYTQFDIDKNFSKKTFKQNNSIFYVDKGAAGHLGVSYVIIQENSLKKMLLALKHKIIYSTIGIYIIIVIVGFSLAKLFMYPIQSQRKKLNTFIKDTTHELNTPLSALLLCINSENFSDIENTQRIKLSAKKISNLYKDLTYLTLKEHQEKTASVIDISKILIDELSYQEQLAHKKKIKMTHLIEGTILKINKEDFTRLINNLISNAIKYTKRNGKIDITLKNGIFIIKDTGIGIEKDKLNKIYERYYRATTDVGGFGIGLNIVYSICKNYNIKIDVKSKLHVGTTFTLYFN